MFPKVIIIEEENANERQRREWRPEPLYAPRPERRRRPSDKDHADRNDGGTVIIIDISDYTETRR